MNIETLRVFCDVVQHQSFSRGAAANQVSQSAATQSVHRMERHFGVQLVDRSKRPFVLTPEGQACYEGFREVLEVYDAVETRVRSLRKEMAVLSSSQATLVCACPARRPRWCPFDLP